MANLHRAMACDISLITKQSQRAVGRFYYLHSCSLTLCILSCIRVCGDPEGHKQTITGWFPLKTTKRWNSQFLRAWMSPWKKAKIRFTNVTRFVEGPSKSQNAYFSIGELSDRNSAIDGSFVRPLLVSLAFLERSLTFSTCLVLTSRLYLYRHCTSHLFPNTAAILPQLLEPNRLTVSIKRLSSSCDHDTLLMVGFSPRSRLCEHCARERPFPTRWAMIVQLSVPNSRTASQRRWSSSAVHECVLFRMSNAGADGYSGAMYGGHGDCRSTLKLLPKAYGCGRIAPWVTKGTPIPAFEFWHIDQKWEWTARNVL